MKPPIITRRRRFARAGLARGWGADRVSVAGTLLRLGVAGLRVVESTRLLAVGCLLAVLTSVCRLRLRPSVGWLRADFEVRLLEVRMLTVWVLDGSLAIFRELVVRLPRVRLLGLAHPDLALPNLAIPGFGLPGVGLPGFGLPGVGLPTVRLLGKVLVPLRAFAVARLRGSAGIRWRIMAV